MGHADSGFVGSIPQLYERYMVPLMFESYAADLNQPMLDRAAEIGTVRPIAWRQADVSHRPFPDGAFDAVVCQFGVMFFQDKAGGYAEVKRVLGPGGIFLFNVWDRIEQNEFADTVDRALQTTFPRNPPRFMARVPHGYGCGGRTK